MAGLCYRLSSFLRRNLSCFAVEEFCRAAFGNRRPGMGVAKRERWELRRDPFFDLSSRGGDMSRMEKKRSASIVLFLSIGLFVLSTLWDACIVGC